MSEWSDIPRNHDNMSEWSDIPRNQLIVKRLEREIITSIRLAHSQKIEEGNNNLHQVSS
jgi:hypothetical protein